MAAPASANGRETVFASSPFSKDPVSVSAAARPRSAPGAARRQNGNTRTGEKKKKSPYDLISNGSRRRESSSPVSTKLLISCSRVCAACTQYRR